MGVSLDGLTWNLVGVVSSDSALLLSAELADGHQLRYTGDAANGETASISFYAWDQTSGVAGTKADPTPYVNTGAFSLTTDTATITVTAVNDAPRMTSPIP